MVTWNWLAAGAWNWPLATRSHCVSGAGSGCLLVMSSSSSRVGDRMCNVLFPGRGISSVVLSTTLTGTEEPSPDDGGVTTGGGVTTTGGSVTGGVVTGGLVLGALVEPFPAASQVARPLKALNAIPVKVVPSRPTVLAGTSRR